MKKVCKFFTMREDSLWKELCQRVADFHFYRSLLKDLPEKVRDSHLEKYFKWIDRKFMFEKENK